VAAGLTVRDSKGEQDMGEGERDAMVKCRDSCRCGILPEGHEQEG